MHSTATAFSNAFATLAPSAQSFFGKPDKFLRSVAEEMPPILLTRTFAFLGAERTENRTVQQVLITDVEHLREALAGREGTLILP